MCGIIGCISEGRAAAIGMEALKRLEYRGYDSAGAALIKDGKLLVLKDKGRIGDMDAKFGVSSMGCGMAVMHTRWATHGQPNSANAHPHTDCERKIAIVHNGIIENYSALKKMLESEGHIFKSETDSEVIAHLIEKFRSIGLSEAVKKAMPLLEGAYAIAAISEGEECIVATRRGSPLALGMGDGLMMVASDASALVGFAKSIVYLNDNEVCEIRRDSYNITNELNRKVRKEEEALTLTLGQIEKGGFRHFMFKEIFEQPETMKNVLRGRLTESGVKLSIGDAAKKGRVVIVACGTSWHAGLVGKYLIEGIARVPVEVEYASEFRYRNPLVGPDDLVVAISQSGETADTLAAIKEAKSKGARTLGIVNVVGSSIAREVSSGIFIHAGPEIGVASTKAFTAQLASLCLLALDLKQSREGSFDGRLAKAMLSLPDAIAKALESSDVIREIAGVFAGSKDFLYLGRGINFPVALEGALKLKEISYIHAEGYPAGEMKHGPIALIDKGMPVVFITSGGRLDKLLGNMEEVKARGGRIISVASEPVDERIGRLSDYIIKVPKTIDELSPIVNAIPLQLLAYHMADAKGIDMDKPRNLAKSVTVE